MSWKLRQSLRNSDTSAAVFYVLVIPAIIGLLTATVPTLIIIFLVIIVRIFKNFNVLSNSKYKKDLEKQRKEKEEERKFYADRDNVDGKWWTSNPVYSRKPEKPEIKKGKRGGRYTEDKTKDGRPYRRYF